MKMAINLAKKGNGKTSPNPLVGTVIVKDDLIIGKGYHKFYGGPHAEINALNKAGEKAIGATLYVNLEPCIHFGKTPPCVREIIKSGIKKVVIGMRDPNPFVFGKGIEELRKAKIEVKEGVLEDEAKKLNEVFIKYITLKIPFVALKVGMSLDGKISTNKGHSKWITNELSRNYVKHLRQIYDAILVGINTTIVDNPNLTIEKPFKKKFRIILDSKARIPFTANLLKQKDNYTTIIATTKRASINKLKKLEKYAEILILKEKNGLVDLRHLMKELVKMEISSILVEGGGEVNASFLKEMLVDKVFFFISPKIIGGNFAKNSVGGKGISSLNNAINLRDIKLRKFKEDILFEGYVVYRNN